MLSRPPSPGNHRAASRGGRADVGQGRWQFRQVERQRIKAGMMRNNRPWRRKATIFWDQMQSSV